MAGLSESPERLSVCTPSASAALLAILRLEGDGMTASPNLETHTIWHEEHPADRTAMLAMRAMIAAQPAADLGPAGRPAFDALMEHTPAADGVTYEAVTVGGVPGWWCRPSIAAAGAAILYLHGGGYGVGSARAYRTFVGQIVSRANVAAFVADYALAPERPFPAAVQDAQAAYSGLAAIDIDRIAIVGDSAGGGLALVTAVQMSQEPHGVGPSLAGVVAISPWADLALTGESLETRAKQDPLLNREMLNAASGRYLGAAAPRAPEASPLYADLAGLPPVLLHVGDDEILLDDARRVAQRLREVGVSSELHVWQGMAHVFPANVALLQAAGEALDNIGGFLRGCLERQALTSPPAPSPEPPT